MQNLQKPIETDTDANVAMCENDTGYNGFNTGKDLLTRHQMQNRTISYMHKKLRKLALLV